MVPVPEKDLPVKLPEVKKYKPTDTGESPLARVAKWVNVKCPKCGSKAKRETDVMPNWAGSSWYFLRYIDPKNKKALAGKAKMKRWMPVDWYNGGMEHTTLHLLYSRFWNKFLFDIGVVPVDEPYQKRTSHGMVLGEGGEKMSKSRGNVVNPDEVVRDFGADAFRVYQMFMGPFDQAIPWSTDGLKGARRFLDRVFALSKRINKNRKYRAKNKKIESLLHRTIKKVTEDIEEMKFNTAVSSLMVFVNEIEKEKDIPFAVYSKFLVLLSPFAPHITEEIWHSLGNKNSIHLQKWPKFDSGLVKEDEFDLIVQVNGRTRVIVKAARGISEKEAFEVAVSDKRVKRFIKGGSIKKTIFVPDKLINIVL